MMPRKTLTALTDEMRGMSEGVFFFKLRKPFIIRFGMVVFAQALKNRYLFSPLHSTWSRS